MVLQKEALGFRLGFYYFIICPANFASSLKLLFSTGPGLGVPLSSYLEVALHKFDR